MKKLRAFLAIDLEEDIRDRALELARRLAEARPDVKWVEPENLHLTIKFLGDIDDVEAWKLSQSLEPVIKSCARFPLTLEGLGVFPAMDRPRTLWIGVSEGEPALLELAEAVEAKTRALGYPGEQRRFHPHLTLGRVRGNDNKQALQAKIEELASIELGQMQVKSLILFSSQLRKVGPHYSRMATLPLRK